ncbi:pentatricopeptide repeat-containing protein At1g74600, chloroplastic [Punica granatum]|uniref:Pentatricopeptide repeat-containing protein At1g74600, chloroplastic n=1 Tax=Punica granatum TaxID=22663 RepID=A0A6P8E577_PUNGR|nr:pentatricopeptide repeat-containing protein At1g74600, chloroplastic [Punica granatum]
MKKRLLLSSVRRITTYATEHMPLCPPNVSAESDTDPRSDVYFKNLSIDGFIRAGNLRSALTLFDKMPSRDVVTYNLLISGQAQHGHAGEALQLYSNMVSDGIRESPRTFSSVLSICRREAFFGEGMQVQCRVISLGLSSNSYIGSSLIDLYMHMGFTHLALVLFDELADRSLATWNLVLRGLCEVHLTEEALSLFGEMKSGGFEPNGLSFCYLIGGCGKEMLLDEGKQLHCHVIKAGWEKSNMFVDNSLVDLYSACRSLIDARQSFHSIPAEDVISWNSIIWVCSVCGLLSDARELFSRMQFWGRRPSVRSLVGFLNASSKARNIQLGKQVHCYVMKSGFDQNNVHVQSAVIDMYGKCGEIELSFAFLDGLPERSLECYNSFMTALLRCGITGDVIELFGLMVDEGVGFDEVTLSASLKALAISPSGSLLSCRLLHSCIIKSGFESDLAVSSSMIDAYSKFGQIDLSTRVFYNLSSLNCICFTSIISAYARNGRGRESIRMLERMVEMGLKPDEVTFLSALNGCNHSGLVEEGWSLFHSMKHHFGVPPDRRHYSCMVDLLGRAGMVSEAEELLLWAPEEADSVAWSSLLRSCRIHRNETVARRAAGKLMELESEDPAVSHQVSNFFAEIGEFEMSTHTRQVNMARKYMDGQSTLRMIN